MKRLIRSRRLFTGNWLSVLAHVVLLNMPFFYITVVYRQHGHYPISAFMPTLCMLLASLCLLSGTYWVLWSLLLEHPIRWRDYEAAVRQFAPTFLAVHVLLSVIGVVYTLVASGLTLPLLRLTGAYDSGNRSLSLIIVRGFSSFLYRCMEVYVLAWVYAGGLRLRGAFQQGLLSNNLLPWERMPVLLVVALICGAEAVISKLMLSESVPYWAFVGISTGRHLLLGLLLAIAFVTACQSVSEASERNK